MFAVSNLAKVDELFQNMKVLRTSRPVDTLRYESQPANFQTY